MDEMFARDATQHATSGIKRKPVEQIGLGDVDRYDLSGVKLGFG
jgi:hypothetical protein